MKVLIIGGTRFVGLAIAQEALARGYSVTIFHRGTTTNNNQHLTGAKFILGDRDSDLSNLVSSTEKWDVTIDVCAYRPNQVTKLADVLHSKTARYVYISTVSVYAEDVEPHSNESGKLVSAMSLLYEDTDTCPINAITYGPLKLLCEQRCTFHFPSEKLLIVRPTFVFGPQDYTMRLPTWIQRISAGGVVDCPAPRDAPIQYVDVRDQAIFTIDLIEKQASGVFHTAIAPEITFEQLLDNVVSAVGAADVSLNWVDADTCQGRLSAAEAKHKDDDPTIAKLLFPLWSRGKPSGVMTMDSTAAVSAGLKFRPLGQTIIDTKTWLDSMGL